MSFRSSQLYVRPQTKHRLHLLARVTTSEDVNLTNERKTATVDELGDTIINTYITLNWPEIPQMEAEIEAVEEKFAESIRKRKEEKP